MRNSQGPFDPKPQLAILDELILTLLSQHTSDVNRDRAFASLKGTFPSWESVESAPVDEIADAIRSGGIATIKAGRIKRILAEVREREGDLDLRRLNELSDDEVTEYLVSLPGVGPKSAACVLMFSMGRPAFPIDTHVHRVSRRLGLIADNVTADAAHRVLGPRVPPEIRYDLHVALIRHGREICTPRRPRCGSCVLLDLCAAGPRFIASGEARD